MKVVTPVKDEHIEGWTVIRNDDGSSVLTEDGKHYFQVTLEGCSCGKAHCVHQKIIYPTPPPPPRPPEAQNPFTYRNGEPAKPKKLPKPEKPKEVEPFRLPENNFMAGLVAIGLLFKGLGAILTAVGNLLAHTNGEEE